MAASVTMPQVTAKAQKTKTPSSNPLANICVECNKRLAPMTESNDTLKCEKCRKTLHARCH